MTSLWYIRTVRAWLDFWYKRLCFYTRSEKAYKRPSINIWIRKWKYNEWKLFSKYHYLDHWLNKACSNHIYIAEFNNEPIWFIAVLHFPHPSNNKLKKIHRLVIRPDYQWLWIWIKFLEEVSKIYIEKWFDIRITTSNFALLFWLKNRKNWKCLAYWKGKLSTWKLSKDFNKTSSNNRKIATFKYFN